MTTSVDYAGFTRMLSGAIRSVSDHHEYLSQLDTVIGDGDHGVTMLRSMKKLASILDATQIENLETLLNEMSWALLGIDGGASGPLLGLIFMGFAEAAAGKTSLDSAGFVALFDAGLASLRKQTKAGVGDKTLMDALIPAIEAMHQAATAGADLETLFDQAAAAAEQGVQSTREMVARFGRAKNQGQRTLGHQDPMATTIAFFIAGLRAGLNE
jgi:phosphoenolpyruvate---glycerone phosphotransferase subunit DhaL